MDWEDSPFDSRSTSSSSDVGQEFGIHHNPAYFRPEDAGGEDSLDAPLGGGESSVVGDNGDSSPKLPDPGEGEGAGARAVHQPPANVDLYSSAFGMKLVVVDCFEEMFAPGFSSPNADAEIQEAIQSGMDPEKTFIEAARAHRALSMCMRLPTESVLYKRLFSRLTSALLKVKKVSGTVEERKSVFFLEATGGFDVETEGVIIEQYFDDLHLTPPLFHVDLLVTKLVQVGRPTHPHSNGRRTLAHSLAEAHCSRTMAPRVPAHEQRV